MMFVGASRRGIATVTSHLGTAHTRPVVVAVAVTTTNGSAATSTSTSGGGGFATGARGSCLASCAHPFSSYACNMPTTTTTTTTPTTTGIINGTGNNLSIMGFFGCCSTTRSSKIGRHHCATWLGSSRNFSTALRPSSDNKGHRPTRVGQATYFPDFVDMWGPVSVDMFFELK